MKKIIALVLAFVCVLSLVGCTPTTTDKGKDLIELPYPRVEGGVEIGVPPTD